MRGIATIALFASTAGASTWIQVSSPTIEIFTDSGLRRIASHEYLHTRAEWTLK
jgi:hypothetical protein